MQEVYAIQRVLQRKSWTWSHSPVQSSTDAHLHYIYWLQSEDIRMRENVERECNVINRTRRTDEHNKGIKKDKKSEMVVYN